MQQDAMGFYLFQVGHRVVYTDRSLGRSLGSSPIVSKVADNDFHKCTNECDTGLASIFCRYGHSPYCAMRQTHPQKVWVKTSEYPEGIRVSHPEDQIVPA